MNGLHLLIYVGMVAIILLWYTRTMEKETSFSIAELANDYELTAYDAAELLEISPFRVGRKVKEHELEHMCNLFSEEQDRRHAFTLLED